MNQPGTIGIIGGGQLGRMLTQAATSLGFQVVVVDPNENCAAAQVGAKQIVGGWDDQAALHELSQIADYITVETEHIDSLTLDEIVASGTPVNPAPQTIRLIQDKLIQKQALKAAGLPVADFVEVNDETSARQALKTFGGKMLLKTRTGGYDGRGNALIASPDDITSALKNFDGHPLYAEQFVVFTKELAVMVACSDDGATASYPVTETIHERSICIQTMTPAALDPSVAEQAERTALAVANFLDGAGVFGIELFLAQDNQIIINEIAPRVHNSGHYTIEACRVSQFEQHIRAIAGLPLGVTDMVVPAACMVNILGERDGPTQITGLDAALQHPNVSVHLYGKSPTKIDRKMGHLTATGSTAEQAHERALLARKSLSV